MPSLARDSRVGLAERLRARQAEIAAAALNRVHFVSDPEEIAGAEYREGLRSAVSAALGYGIEGFECPEECSPSVPTVLLDQARLAARNRINLDAVLRRYIAGYTVFSDFVVEAAEEEEIPNGPPLKCLLRVQAALFDRLVFTVTDEYNREADRPGSTQARREEQVRRLLVGDLSDAPGLRYDLGAHHLGLVGRGERAVESLQEALCDLDLSLLAIPAAEDGVWAWLGSRRELHPAPVKERLKATSLCVAIGEPAKEISGWRLTHRQAQAALPVALSGPERVLRYRDVALLASILADELLATSLRQIYITPLEAERDGGQAARQTLRAYFDSARHVSSTAALLGVNRNTVTKRLQAIEETIGRSLHSSATELEAALRLQEYT